MIDVRERERAGTLPALRNIDLLLQVAVRVAPVGKPGQLVVGGLALELFRLHPEFLSTLVDELFEAHAHQGIFHDHQHARGEHGERQQEIRQRFIDECDCKNDTSRRGNILDDHREPVEHQARIRVAQEEHEHHADVVDELHREDEGEDEHAGTEVQRLYRNFASHALV